MVEHGEEYIPTPEEADIAIELQHIFTALDIYFITPFGYYLQLIQPLYPSVYDVSCEIDELLYNESNYTEVRNKLFAAAVSYDLTILGKQMLFADKEKKPKSLQTMPKRIADYEIDRMLEANREYLEVYDELDLFDEAEREDWNDDENIKVENYKEGKNVLRVDFSKGKNNRHDKVFVFKVKLFYAKRVWRQIEIIGSDTLDDLHETIAGVFNLEWGHLYSFFMSNRAWDSNSEYCHSQAEGRRADKAIISRLELRIKQKFMYLYDYGDEHCFEVELIDIKEKEKAIKYPRETKRNKPTVTT